MNKIREFIEKNCEVCIGHPSDCNKSIELFPIEVNNIYYAIRFKPGLFEEYKDIQIEDAIAKILNMNTKDYDFPSAEFMLQYAQERNDFMRRLRLIN